MPGTAASDGSDGSSSPLIHAWPSFPTAHPVSLEAQPFRLSRHETSWELHRARVNRIPDLTRPVSSSNRSPKSSHWPSGIHAAATTMDPDENIPGARLALSFFEVHRLRHPKLEMALRKRLAPIALTWTALRNLHQPKVFLHPPMQGHGAIPRACSLL